MKKLISAVLSISLLLGPLAAHASSYEGKCIIPQGKFKKCYLDFSKQGWLKIQYKDFEYHGLNLDIPGKDILGIETGEKAKHRWAVVGGAIYALGPLGALFLLWKKKEVMFSLEYRNGKSKESTLFSVTKKLGSVIGQELDSIRVPNLATENFNKY